jgi:hypothetical protein
MSQYRQAQNKSYELVEENDDEKMGSPLPKTSSDTISSTQFIGLFIWIIALILHLICVGEPFTQFKLILYLVACCCEIYILKFFIADTDTLFFLKDL